MIFGVAFVYETCYYDTQIHTKVWYKGIFVILTLKNKRIVRYKGIIKYVCQFCVIKVCHNNINLCVCFKKITLGKIVNILGSILYDNRTLTCWTHEDHSSEQLKY
jgi:hypothetical protein